MKRRDDRVRLTRMREVGLGDKDMAIMTIAANRSFRNELEPPTIAEASHMGFERLQYLGFARTEMEDGDLTITVLYDQTPVLHYFISGGNLTNDWHEVSSVGLELSATDESLEAAMSKIYGWLREAGVDELSLYGFFALDCLYVAMQSHMTPMHLQYFPESHRLGLVLYDPLRGSDVALIAMIDTWRPTEGDNLAGRVEDELLRIAGNPCE
ncbi:hypothetical protein [Xanthomonas phage RTH11]|nr:hypothetical protein [Xanthomonas phage RTH11]